MSAHTDLALQGWVSWEAAPLDTTIWGVYGPDCFPTVFACKINNHPQCGRTIWGFSVYEGEPGFRTLGQSSAWAEEHDLCLFLTKEAAFDHVAGLFDPLNVQQETPA